MNGNNLNTSKLTRMIKSKGFVTGLCGVLAVAVLIIGYNIRINNATKPVSLPVARVTINPKTKITDDMIEYREVPRGALNSEYYNNKNQILGKYTKINAIIPAGSMFYTELITDKEELPDSALYDVPKGETLYYLTVNMLTSYTNSILPNNYVDIYMSTRDNGKALVGKLLKNVKILAVKTSDGKNVFEGGDATRIPYVIIFSLPEEQHLLLRKITAINNFSIANEDGGFARIDITPVPTNININNRTDEIVSEVSSEYLSTYVLNMAAELPEE